MGKSRPLSISISANQICELSSTQSLWDKPYNNIVHKMINESNKPCSEITQRKGFCKVYFELIAGLLKKKEIWEFCITPKTQTFLVNFQ